MNSDYKGFIYDPDLGVEVRSMAQPLITFYENEEYYESGICDMCGLEVVCTHKYARCPYCFSDVGCS